MEPVRADGRRVKLPTIDLSAIYLDETAVLSPDGEPRSRL